MEERKKCITCGIYLMGFQGYYLHPEIPCSGLRDYLMLEAQIEDEFLHEKFEKIYGKPIYSDYERITLLEAENNRMSEQLLVLHNQIDILKVQLNNPLIKFLMKILRMNPPL